jgi:SAM-dependent methyltransferase
MEPSHVYNLLTPAGQKILSDAMSLNPREADFLMHFQVLSRQYPRELARDALTISILRGSAASKFPQAGKMYFTRDALEQASSYEISRYRAKRYRGFKRVFDLGCSIGGDTLALSEECPTVGIDRDPLRLAMAQANFASLGFEAAFIQADLRSALPFMPCLTGTSGVFFDPSRRVSKRRIHTVERYIPPLSTITGWLTHFPALGVKLSPGVQLDEVESYDAEIEFISLKGGLKEAILWFGPLKSAKHRATLLPGQYTLVSSRQPGTNNRLSEPRAYLYEPDPAILRAGLVRDLAVQLNAYQLDPDIAYLTTDTRCKTPFARIWVIEDWFPFQLKRLRAYLRERHVGQVVVKKRGSPLQPEALINDLRLKGDAERVVFLTHLVGRPIVVVCYTNDIELSKKDTGKGLDL